MLVYYCLLQKVEQYAQCVSLHPMVVLKSKEDPWLGLSFDIIMI